MRNPSAKSKLWVDIFPFSFNNYVSFHFFVVIGNLLHWQQTLVYSHSRWIQSFYETRWNLMCQFSHLQRSQLTNERVFVQFVSFMQIKKGLSDWNACVYHLSDSWQNIQNILCPTCSFINIVNSIKIYFIFTVSVMNAVQTCE